MTNKQNTIIIIPRDQASVRDSIVVRHSFALSSSIPFLYFTLFVSVYLLGILLVTVGSGIGELFYLVESTISPISYWGESFWSTQSFLIGLRLFAQMMAGHSLLKISSGFALSMLGNQLSFPLAMAFDRDNEKGKAPALPSPDRASSSSGWRTNQEEEAVERGHGWPTDSECQRWAGWPTAEECADLGGPPVILTPQGFPTAAAEQAPIVPVEDDPSVTALYSVTNQIAICEQILYDTEDTVRRGCDINNSEEVKENFPEIAATIDKLQTLREEQQNQIIAIVLAVHK